MNQHIIALLAISLSKQSELPGILPTREFLLTTIFHKSSREGMYGCSSPNSVSLYCIELSLNKESAFPFFVNDLKKISVRS